MGITGTPEDRIGDTGQLRPVERRVLRWAATGLSDAEIGRMFRRGEGWATQVRFLAGLDRSGPLPRSAEQLRPLERRLLRWREQGVSHDELGRRFVRSPAFLARVEGYARSKL